MSPVLQLLARIGLQKRILLSVAVGLGIALGGFLLLSVRMRDESAERLTNDQLVVAQVTAGHVDYVLRDIVGELQSLAAQSSLDVSEAGSDGQQAALARVYQALRGMAARVLLIDESGRVVSAYPVEGGATGRDYSQRPYVQRALSAGLPAISTTFSESVGERPGIGVGVPLRDRSGLLRGLVGAEVSLVDRGFGDLLPPVKVGRTGYLQLVDENGLVLASTAQTSAPTAGEVAGADQTTHPEHYPELVREGQTVVRTCHTCHQASRGLQRGRDIMAFVPLSAAPFGLAVRLAEDDVTGASNDTWRWLVLYSFAVLAIGLLFAWITTSAVVKPLEQLTQAARRIGAGDLDSPVQLLGRPGASEATTLAATLEAMRRRLHASIERIERWNRDLEERVAQRTRELSILFEVSQTLARTVEVGALMQMVVEKIVAVVDAADAAILYRYDEAQGLLTPSAAVGYLSGLGEVRLKPGEAMAGLVLAEGRALLFANGDEVRAALATASPQNAEHLWQVRDGLARTEAALGAPIVYEGQVVGVLLLASLRQQGTFSPTDVAIVQAIADQVAVAIEHARLVHEAGQLQALRETDRLKSQFLLNVSHELRTPLSSIVSLVEVLAADYRTIPRRQLGQVLSILERSAGRLKDMVENLLDAGSIRAGRFRVRGEPRSLTEIVQDALVCVRPLLDRKHQSVVVDSPAGDVCVLADHDRMVQVFVNLLSNANKYCPEGDSFRISLERQGDIAQVRLVDTGPGISTEDQPHLFEPFYRSARPLSETGAGLGLAIVKGIVEAHGGQVALLSQMGVGTTVSFTLPLTEVVDSAAAPAGAG